MFVRASFIVGIVGFNDVGRSGRVKGWIGGTRLGVRDRFGFASANSVEIK